MDYQRCGNSAFMHPVFIFPERSVAQVGPGKRNDDGSRQSPEVGVGDKVLYSKYAGTDIKLSGDEYVLLSEKDILAVVN